MKSLSIIVVCLLFNTCASDPLPANSLRLVVAVFRHGERTPTSTYPNDPHKNKDYYPLEWGALTKIGRKNQYEIGKLLRTRYKSFLSEIYSPRFMKAQTTDIDRTKMSMQLVQAGLYPPIETQRWKNDLNWQPIPYKHEPLFQDKAGKKNQYEIGKLLRTRYKSFLSDIYSPRYVTAQTTDFDRTKMSMQLVLAGLFPPTEAQKWNNDLTWQPIPYQYEPLSQDKLLLVNTPCEVHRYNEAMDEVMKLEEVKQLMKENEPTFELLTNMTGMEVKEFNNLLLIQGILKAQAELNLKLPNWTEKVYPEPLNQLAAKAFSLFAYTPELRRIKGGPLLRTILEHLTDKSNNSGKNQLYLYAAHDNTIANLLNALRVWKEHVPDYNAMILIELHQLNRNNLHAVKIFYRKSENHELDELKLSGCGEVCSLEEIQHLTRDVIATDSTKHCMDADFDKLFGELLPGDLGGIEYLPNGRGRGNFFKNTNLKQDFSKTFLGDGL